MKGDVIFPKSCIEGMPYAWRLLLKLLEAIFMRHGRNAEMFKAIDIDLQARHKDSGRFVSKPWYYV